MGWNLHWSIIAAVKVNSRDDGILKESQVNTPELVAKIAEPLSISKDDASRKFITQPRR